MAMNEWKIWRKLKLAKEKEVEEVKAKDDLNAVIDSLKEIEVNELVKKLELMIKMVKDGEVVDEKLQIDNLERQIKLFDDIIKGHSFLENDVDINGLRLRKVGKGLLQRAKELGRDDLVNDRKKELLWR